MPYIEMSLDKRYYVGYIQLHDTIKPKSAKLHSYNSLKLTHYSFPKTEGLTLDCAIISNTFVRKSVT